MLQTRTYTLCLALLSVVFAVTTACGSTTDPTKDSRSIAESSVTDWESLRPAESPNNWLVAPGDGGFPPPDEVAPTFDVKAAILASIWKAVIEDQPRTTILTVSGDGLQIEATQRSALFGFVDRISSRIIALDFNRAFLVVYSQATVGYWHLEANRRRLKGWLNARARRISSL